jgi:immunity protein 53 of polymorphic toxin system
VEQSLLQRLASWYERNCDGRWEHGQGVKIETLDNPGWSISIDLKGTALEATPFLVKEDRYHEQREWLRCWKDGVTFRAACGPRRLEDAVNLFVEWAEKHDST